MAEDTLAQIREARERIKHVVHTTPLLTNKSLDHAATEAYQQASSSSSKPIPVRLHLAFKCEHLQKGGAFKARGATNAVLYHLEQAKTEDANLDPKKVWFVTHSSGNHAGALARAAQVAGASAAVVMPLTTPAPKQAAVRGYGARAVMCDSNLQARESTAQRVMEDLRAEVGSNGKVIFVHPYDEPLVIAGQGTLGELVDQGRQLVLQGWGSGVETGLSYPDDLAQINGHQPQNGASLPEADSEPCFDLVLTPCGGGGQLSGLSTAIKGADPRIRCYGVEPEEADDAARSVSTGVLQPPVNPPTSIADGLLTALSPRTFAHIQKNVSGILTTSEEWIMRALRLTWERTKQMVEPSACVGYAAILQAKPEWLQLVDDVVKHKLEAQPSLQAVDVRVGVVWTGGNVELPKMVAALEKIPK
ncbi:hypothetical protein OC846_003268 [Tilletia horrida]|uniref:Tryptophan synthase beta chain-like PALP domain-containing protein n=1 Tax=Tilletia horrida TaxID=155126 RepID=A0AAN6JS70_9BASI|nr:hypothetical protein OC845_004188 [Tilletia horrida]KAK0551490.1 hypothetical protein OC846_003268 [Tilletia horrida]KAK0566512.1 hypothetical protein OC861_003202 [Tilletia horrida]